MVVTGISPTAARVETAVRELAASGGDIFQATSIVLAIVGAGGRAVVAEVADDLRPQLRAGGGRGGRRLPPGYDDHLPRAARRGGRRRRPLPRDARRGRRVLPGRARPTGSHEFAGGRRLPQVVHGRDRPPPAPNHL